jgi:hypothetical protein
MGQHNATIRRDLDESIGSGDVRRVTNICNTFDITKIEYDKHYNKTPLHTAVLIGIPLGIPRVEIIKLLAKRYPQFLESVDEIGRTPAHIAACSGLIRVLKLFGKINPRAFAIQNYEGETPLCHAVSERNYSAAKFILRVAADTVDATNCDGKTPLHVAAARSHCFGGGGCDLMIAFLISCGSQAINRRDKNGDTPLHSCLKTGCCNSKTIITLVRFGADLDAISNNGDKPMNSAIRYHLNPISLIPFQLGIHLAKIMVALTVGTEKVWGIRCSERKVFEIRCAVYFEQSLVIKLLFYCL